MTGARLLQKGVKQVFIDLLWHSAWLALCAAPAGKVSEAVSNRYCHTALRVTIQAHQVQLNVKHMEKQRPCSGNSSRIGQGYVRCCFATTSAWDQQGTKAVHRQCVSRSAAPGREATSLVCHKI